MWKRLRRLSDGLWQRLASLVKERRLTRKRAHFWAEMRAGEREAEAQSRRQAAPGMPTLRRIQECEEQEDRA